MKCRRREVAIDLWRSRDDDEIGVVRIKSQNQDVFCMREHFHLGLPGRVVLVFAPALVALVLASCSGSSPSSMPANPGGGPTTPGNPVGSNLTLISSDPYSV